MSPAKTWMRLVDERLNDEYLEGVENFLDYVFSHAGREDEIRCPCIKCCNTYSHSRKLVSAHLKVYGILRNYTFWYHMVKLRGNLTALAQERCHSQLNKSGLVYQRIARRTLPEKSSQIADFRRKRVTHSPHLQDEELWKKYESDGNDAPTNTPILFTTNWDTDDSGSMNDEADASNDGHMGNDMDEFYEGAKGVDELMGNENLESEESQGNHGHAATSKTRPQTGEKRRVRGKNKCKEVADLMESQKIKVWFYNNRALSKRHLGRIVCNPRITPMRVKEWSNITDAARKHIFDAIKDKFENIDENIAIDVYKDEILDHVKKLWINWRGDLHRHFVKPNKTMQEAMKKVPKDIPKDDWEWLVKEHFFSKEFLKKSKRNTQNRANLKMLHQSGSKPFRQIIWDMGGKENKPPSMDKLFSETHKKGTAFADSTTSAKHAQIKTIVQSNPVLSNDEVMQKCDTSKRHDRVVGFGGGIRARALQGPALSKSELVSKLQTSEKEKQVLEEKVNGMAQEVSEIKRLLSGRSLSDSSHERQHDQE